MEKQKEVQKEYEEYQYMLDTETWKKELSQFKLSSSEKISKNPKVSIIIANYNNAPYLKKMMDSLVQQTIGIEQLQGPGECSRNGRDASSPAHAL